MTRMTSSHCIPISLFLFGCRRRISGVALSISIGIPGFCRGPLCRITSALVNLLFEAHG